MIIVDNALRKLEAEGRPIRVALVGAGFMGQGLANQLVHSVPGMRLVAVANRRGERAMMPSAAAAADLQLEPVETPVGVHPTGVAVRDAPGDG